MAWLQCLLHGHIYATDSQGVYCKRCGKRFKGSISK